MNSVKLVLTIILLVFSTRLIYADNRVELFANVNAKQIQFAVDEINEALKRKGYGFVVNSLSKINQVEKKVNTLILINISDKSATEFIKELGVKNIDDVENEGFIIYKKSETDKTIWILGKDDAGVMYGGLEVAELINVRGIEAVKNQIQNPYMKVRGSKFNIPLDVRTPTYTDPCDAAQKNIAEMWNFDFWKEYIDNMARYRYNTISLWNMHPFPSMVKVPDYPNVALNDVRKSTVAWKENYPLNGWNFDAPEIVNNYKVIKKISIDEKIKFWRKVMAYGKSRNVQFFILTWNIFVYGTEGKYGITDRLENKVTTDYFRKSIKQMVLTYPDLAGIGLTTGENMYDYSDEQKEEWAFATYGQGILDAIKEQPNRKINLIHRQHQTDAKDISRIFKDVMKNENINFVFSFKYAQAHVYSSINQIFHQEFVKDVKSEDKKTLWTLRNDDIFYFRWGAPNFVRDFIKNIPYDVSEGFYYGSDQYVWGREFLTKQSGEPRQIEIVKHWYQWMCWGRLGYNPNMENDRFIDFIQFKFPTVNAKEMFDAWQNASMIYPWVTGFHWGALDFQWYIESGQSQPSFSHTPTGYHDVNRFITLKPHAGTGYISIPDYTKSFFAGTKLKGETPIEVAKKIIENSEQALNWVNKQVKASDGELRISIDDIKTIALLGKYYGHKILGATYLSLFRESLQKEWYHKSQEELNTSAGYWRYYTSTAIANYNNPLWTNRVGHVNWKENFNWVLYDITANGGNINLPSMKPTLGGTILEAEDAHYKNSFSESKIAGFSGKGYLATNVGDKKHDVTWTFNAPKTGSYVLEFRYTQKRHSDYPSDVVVNGKKTGEITFWHSGNTGAWNWDRITVNLEKGENKIKVSPEGWILLDHLNILEN